MQSIHVRNYNLTCVAWDIEKCISAEEIIIMKDGKLFLSSILSFSQLCSQILYLINHFWYVNRRCVYMLWKKVLNEAFHFNTSSVRLQHMLFEFWVFTMLLVKLAVIPTLPVKSMQTCQICVISARHWLLMICWKIGENLTMIWQPSPSKYIMHC